MTVQNDKIQYIELKRIKYYKCTILHFKKTWTLYPLLYVFFTKNVNYTFPRRDARVPHTKKQITDQNYRRQLEMSTKTSERI